MKDANTRPPLSAREAGNPAGPGSHDAQPLWQAPLPLGDLQAQLDEGEEVSTLARPQDWGYFLRVSPELGYFSWFRTREQMLRYLVQVEILHAPTSLPDRARYDALVQELMAVARQFEQDHDA